MEPNRKWFGNTRVIGQESLQKFQKELGAAIKDPFKVVLKTSKLPLSLLDAKPMAGREKIHILDNEFTCSDNLVNPQFRQLTF